VSDKNSWQSQSVCNADHPAVKATISNYNCNKKRREAGRSCDVRIERVSGHMAVVVEDLSLHFLDFDRRTLIITSLPMD